MSNQRTYPGRDNFVKQVINFMKFCGQLSNDVVFRTKRYLPEFHAPPKIKSLIERGCSRMFEIIQKRSKFVIQFQRLLRVTSAISHKNEVRITNRVEYYELKKKEKKKERIKVLRIVYRTLKKC